MRQEFSISLDAIHLPGEIVLSREGAERNYQERYDTDAELLHQIRSGEHTAMAQLYDRYNRLVYSIALRILRERSAAEDILQEVFLRVWRQPDMAVSGPGLGSWFAVVTRNRAIDVLRRPRLQTELNEASFSSSSATRTDSAVKLSEFMECARAAMGKLDTAQRSALELAFFEGLSHSEIAERTNTPLGTVKTRIRSAIQTLRKALR
jgi:RNA polymerase sigma-70 factor, ECF subfamily